MRAGVLEHPTVELLREVGLADRLDREGMPHEGISLRFDGVDHRIDFTDLVGRGITVYGQQEVVKDLIAARLADGGDLRFEVSDVTLDGLADAPVIGYTDAGGQRHELRCDVVAGCDGFHGISRGAYNPEVFDREYPYAWLGILAKAAPTQHELAYASHAERVRALLDAQPRGHPALPAGAAGHRSERLVGQPDLGRAGHAPRGRGVHPQRGPGAWRRASPGCAASSPSPCGTGGCSSQATPRTSSRRRVRRV